MSLFNFAPLIIFIYLVLLLSIIECRPRTQRIVINGHEWTVPNESGWEDVLQEADLVRRKLLSNCATSRLCRQAAEELRQIFLKHPVSAKHFDDSIGSNYPESGLKSIFKWG